MKILKLMLTTLSILLAACEYSLTNDPKGRNLIEPALKNIQVGPRPYFLVNDLAASPLKSKLESCQELPFKKTEFSIGHRGAAMQFPEHTQESYEAAARMGAGIIECDVTFTADKELVCRHSQCDLHTTTNILATPLADQCSDPFTPANIGNPATAKCCTSDITLAQFKTLKGKMEGFNPLATTVSDYMAGTPSFRTDGYASNGTLLSHKESIELFKSLNVKMTPELKAPQVPMPYDGFSQQDYAHKMLNEYTQAQVDTSHVYPQSFNRQDVVQWITQSPAFGEQAVFLDERMDDINFTPTAQDIWALVALDSDNHLIESEYSQLAKAAGLKIITWTLERSGPLASGGGWYYQSIKDAINTDSDQLVLLDFLATTVGVEGVFTDWPGMGL